MERFPEYAVEAISVRDDSWRTMDFSKYDTVFNTTGLAHNDARKGTDEEFIALNVNLPVELAKKAKESGVRQFIHMSSMIVYGSLSPLGKNEKYTVDTIPNPNNIYGKSKLMGEHELEKLKTDSFSVALIRSSLVYGEKAVDNFERLVSFAGKLPVFPDIKNERSMIYADNLCELVRLIIDNKSCGLFYPQQERYICTSRLVKDIAAAMGHKLVLTKLFNPILCSLSGRIGIVDKVFGSEAYEMSMSYAFDGTYRIVSYEESVRRIGKAKGKKSKNG
jgi:UDP-glucose 4-epimerase